MKGLLSTLKSFRISASPVAVDLGTANTLIYVKGKGIVVNEPSVVALDAGDGSVVAFGSKAKEMLGRTPSGIVSAKPVRDGVVSNLKLTAMMLANFMRSARGSGFSLIKPMAVVGVPSKTTQLEMMALQRSAIAAGARRAFVVQEPIAAAIGAGLPVEDPVCNLVIDIGGGTTEIAAVSLMGVVFTRSLRIGGDKLDEAILEFVRNEKGLEIGIQTAEQLKTTIAAVMPSEEKKMKVTGRRVSDGAPAVVEVTSGELAKAIESPVRSIVESVKESLESVPPELSSDLMARGVVLSGGGALLPGLDKAIADENGVPVRIAENPLTTVVRGLAKIVDNPERYSKVIVEPDLP